MDLKELIATLRRAEGELEAVVDSEPDSLFGQLASEKLDEIRSILAKDLSAFTDVNRGRVERHALRVEEWLHGQPFEAHARQPASARQVLGNAAGKALGVLDKGRKAATQEVAWEEVNATVDQLVEVVRTQHAMILDLLDRMARLEGAAATQEASAP
jgi:hypothetical protein